MDNARNEFENVSMELARLRVFNISLMKKCGSARREVLDLRVRIAESESNTIAQCISVISLQEGLRMKHRYKKLLQSAVAQV